MHTAASICPLEKRLSLHLTGEGQRDPGLRLKIQGCRAEPRTWVPTLRPLLPRLAGVTLAFPGAPCRVLTGPSGDCSCQGPACFVLNVVCGFCLSPRCPLRMSLSYDGAGSSPELAAKPTRRSPLPQRAVSMLPWLTGEPWLGGDAWVWTHSQLPLGPAPSQVECPHVPTQKMG